MKIIFLDIDGVMNSERFYHKTPNFEWDMFCPYSVILLNKLTDETNAKIVVSSSWRKNNSVEELSTLFKKNGITGDVYSSTHVLFYKNCDHSVSRGNEIQLWLSQYPETEQYVILDDDSDMLYNQRKNFVHVNPVKGFVKKDYNKALKILMIK